LDEVLLLLSASLSWIAGCVRIDIPPAPASAAKFSAPVLHRYLEGDWIYETKFTRTKISLFERLKFQTPLIKEGLKLVLRYNDTLIYHFYKNTDTWKHEYISITPI
jgi:hypothetical protein